VTGPAPSPSRGPVAVGDGTGAVVGAMPDSPDDAPAMAGSLAEDMLCLVDDGGPGLSEWVSFRSEGLLLDAVTMERRVGAVAGVAAWIERVASRP